MLFVGAVSIVLHESSAFGFVSMMIQRFVYMEARGKSSLASVDALISFYVLIMRAINFHHCSGG